MSHLNRSTIIGRLTKDIELITTDKTVVCDFSVAVNKSWKDKTGEWKEDTQFIQVSAWGKLAESIQGLKKGEEVYVEGPLKKNTWMDKQGAKQLTYKIQANVIRRLTPLERLQNTEENNDKPW